MVEAIKQVVKLMPGARVVAAAPSNAAADLLASRLIGLNEPPPPPQQYSPALGLVYELVSKDRRYLFVTP